MALRAQKWDVLILDEVHYLKNPKARRTANVFGGKVGDTILKPIISKRNLALTGTPVLNRPKEIYGVLKFLCPFGFPVKRDFLERYCNLHLDEFGRWNDMGASNLEELQKKLRCTVMLRRDKSQVLKELPPKTRQVIEIEPGESLKKKLVKEYEEASFKDFKIEFDDVSSMRKETGLAKVKHAIAFLENAIAQSGKVVAFAHHKDVIKAISDKLPSVVVTGDTPLKRRNENVEAFQNNPNIKLFLGNIQAAGVGITLTASSHVVFIEGSWTPGELSQAEDRVHRIGQTQNVLIQHLVWAESLDSYMARKVIGKQEAITEIMETDLEFLE
jgi:SWI/SNF-related matrix-associated actin-dependent regulator 1 of chromatin subfamily A